MNIPTQYIKHTYVGEGDACSPIGSHQASLAAGRKSPGHTSGMPKTRVERRERNWCARVGACPTAGGRSESTGDGGASGSGLE